MKNNNMKKQKEHQDLTFRAVYGNNEEEFLFWDINLHKVHKLFRKNVELNLLDNGKINFSVLFKEDDVEKNQLYEATDVFTNVFYLYDTKMVLYLTSNFGKNEKNKNFPYNLKSESQQYVYRIIQIKWLAYLATLLLDSICNVLKESWQESWIWEWLLRWPERWPEGWPERWPEGWPEGWPERWFWNFFLKGLERLPKNLNDENNNLLFFILKILKDHDVKNFYLSTQDILNKINNWKNELIVRLLSFEEDVVQGALNDCGNMHSYYCASLFRCISKHKINNRNDIRCLIISEIGNKILRKLRNDKKIFEDIKNKCVAIAKHSDIQDSKIWYAISGIDEKNNNVDRKTNKIKKACDIIQNTISGYPAFYKWKIFRCTSDKNNVKYIDENDQEINYNSFKAIFDLNKECFCKKCPLKDLNKEPCSQPRGTTMGKCSRMFSCSERKLFDAVDNDKTKGVIFTSFKNCDICKAVKRKCYRSIKLEYPKPNKKRNINQRHIFQPIADKYFLLKNKGLNKPAGSDSCSC